MKERPILFSGEMVRAILEHRKTQTRRVIRPQPNGGIRTSVFVKSGLEDVHGYEIKLHYGQVGDLLWVREAYAITGHNLITYQADNTTREIGEIEDYAALSSKWRPSIFMPRQMSRIILEIIEISIGQIQNINCDDCIAEGVELPLTQNSQSYNELCIWRFMRLWDSINAKRGFGWYDNPWVWVIKFKRLEAK